MEEVTKLKSQDGRDLITYGGATFVSDLIRHGLIDEYHLFVNPVAIGKGMPIFASLAEKQRLELQKASVFSCGITVLCYRPIP